MPLWRRNPHRAEARLEVERLLAQRAWQRVEATDRLSDHDALIAQMARLVAKTPPGNPTYPDVRAKFGVAHWNRYTRTGELGDLDAYIEWSEDALDAANGHLDDPGRFHADLSFAYVLRNNARPSQEDVEQAIVHGERALRATPEGHASLGYRLHMLGNAHWYRAMHTGVLADLDTAISFQGRAVETGPADRADRYLWFANLAVSHRNRYDLTGVLAHLEASIAHGEQALSLMSEGDPLPMIPLLALGRAYQSRFERTGDPADLEACVARGEQALAAVPEGAQTRHMALSNLATARLFRFQRLGEPADLDTAIDLRRGAVDATEPGSHFRASYLSFLGLDHLHRYRHSGDRADLRASTECGEESIATTPEDSRNGGLHLSNLAAAYRECDPMPDGAAELLIEQAGRLASAPPLSQVMALRDAASLLRGESSARLFRQAIERLPAVAPRELERTDQEHELARHSGLVGDAVAAQLEVGDVEAAVAVAEQGRGILLSAQLDTRTDVSRLAAYHPELAAEFERLRDALNSPPAPEADTAARLAGVRWRREVSADWDRLLARIRALDGFADFLSPTTDLTQATGAVVIVNAATARCDAIVLRAGAPTVVRLPKLTLANVRTNATRLLAATTSTTWAGLLARQRVVPEILAWLAECVTGPVLDAVDERRVWWVPTGLLGMFPLHAAGAAMDRVSSYTPTIRALRQRRPAPRIRTQLAVGITRTAGYADLPGAAAEAELLGSHPGAMVLSDGAATVAGVLAALPDATWAHFACHARYEPESPSHSGVVLSDGTVTVARVSALDLTGAELAYLSACSTARVSEHVADETIHLVSAFQLAGYRHVVGTLWPLEDTVATAAARQFYELVADDPAAALHEVTRQLRAVQPHRPDLWATLIHSGP